MNKKLIIATVVIIIAFLSMHFYHKWYYEDLYRKPKKYVYETYFGPANTVLIIDDLKYKNELIDYYDFMEKNRRDTSTNIPLKGLPQNDPVYVVGYTDDSLLLEVVSLYNRGAHFGGSYTKGYVYIKTVHDFPPPDSLMPGHH